MASSNVNCWFPWRFGLQGQYQRNFWSRRNLRARIFVGCIMDRRWAVLTLTVDARFFSYLRSTFLLFSSLSCPLWTIPWCLDAVARLTISDRSPRDLHICARFLCYGPRISAHMNHRSCVSPTGTSSQFIVPFVFEVLIAWWSVQVNEI